MIEDAKRAVRREPRGHQVLRHAQAQTQAILDTAAEGIVIFDDHGVIESFNQSAEQIFGHKASDMHGQKVSKLMDLQRQPRALQFLADLGMGHHAPRRHGLLWRSLQRYRFVRLVRQHVAKPADHRGQRGGAEACHGPLGPGRDHPPEG